MAYCSQIPPSMNTVKEVVPGVRGWQNNSMGMALKHSSLTQEMDELTLRSYGDSYENSSRFTVERSGRRKEKRSQGSSRDVEGSSMCSVM